MPVTVQQLNADRDFLRTLTTGNLQIVDQGVPQRNQQVLEILGRIEEAGNMRGGPTREILLQLRDLVPGEFAGSLGFHPRPGNKISRMN